MYINIAFGPEGGLLWVDIVVCGGYSSHIGVSNELKSMRGGYGMKRGARQTSQQPARQARFSSYICIHTNENEKSMQPTECISTTLFWGT